MIIHSLLDEWSWVNPTELSYRVRVVASNAAKRVMAKNSLNAFGWRGMGCSHWRRTGMSHPRYVYGIDFSPWTRRTWNCRTWKPWTWNTAILQTPFCMCGLTIQNRVFYEWKQKNLGWAPSCDPTTTILAPWLSATPCSMYEKKKCRKAFPSLS